MRNQSRLGLLVLAFATLALTLLASCGGAGSGASGGDMQGMNHGKKEGAQGEQDGPKKAPGGMAGMDSGSMKMGSGQAARELVMENGEYSDKAFIDAMVPHHQGAVEMAEVALKNAEHDEIRILAEDIVTAQEAEIKDLKSIKREEFGTARVPSGMSQADMGAMGMTDPGRLARERPFDKAFIDAMIPHHKSAIEMAGVAREKTENPEIREIATNIVGAQRREISQMERWREEWYPRG